MKLTDDIVEHFISEEGYRNKAYRDSEGYYTIGIGHLLSKTRNYAGLVWSDEQVIDQFEKDFHKAVKGVEELYPDFYTYGSLVQLALVDMCFQMGKGGLSKFTTTNRLIEDREWDSAADQALKSLWATQTPRRAKRTTDKIRTGTAHDMVDWR